MSKLFEEAIAEAKQLRELAEQNAKNAIVEAVTPRIREFIEEQLLAEGEPETDEKDVEESAEMADDSVLEDVVNEIMAEMSDEDSQNEEKKEKKVLTDADVIKDVNEESYELDEDAMTVLSKMLNERADLTPEEQKLKSIVLSMHTLRSKLPEMNEVQRKEVKTIIKKVKNQILTNEGNMTNDNMLEVDLSETNLTTNEVADGETVEEALNELRLMLDLGEPDEEGAFDMENVLVSDADAAEEGEEEVEGEEGEEEVEGEEGEMADEELDFELEDDAALGAAPEDGEEAAPEEAPLAEEILEINEESLVAALREMKSARTTETTRNTNKTNESAQIATLRGQVAEYGKVIESLREQLTEMNLFNAKLLYVNKLVQDKNVTSEQRRGIVESLDGAKTLREVKLLYKGLTKSLKAATKPAKQISESTARRSIGASSRPVGTKSTQKTLNESTDSTTNRWATLAGLK